MNIINLVHVLYEVVLNTIRGFCIRVELFVDNLFVEILVVFYIFYVVNFNNFNEVRVFPQVFLIVYKKADVNGVTNVFHIFFDFIVQDSVKNFENKIEI